LASRRVEVLLVVCCSKLVFYPLSPVTRLLESRHPRVPWMFVLPPQQQPSRMSAVFPAPFRRHLCWQGRATLPETRGDDFRTSNGALAICRLCRPVLNGYVRACVHLAYSSLGSPFGVGARTIGTAAFCVASPPLRWNLAAQLRMASFSKLGSGTQLGPSCHLSKALLPVKLNITC
jgi:hypothetical protein